MRKMGTCAHCEREWYSIGEGRKEIRPRRIPTCPEAEILAICYECFGVRDARLRHSLGNRTFTYRWFGSVKQSHAHSPFRYYYMCRNPWLFCRSRGLPTRVKISETLRSVERLLILPFILKENRTANMRMMLRGIVDGVLGKGGALKRS